MNRTRYAELDALIVEKIKTGRRTYCALSHNPDVSAMADQLAAHTLNGGWRLIDRRLQALRRAGVIACTGQTWRVVVAELAAAPQCPARPAAGTHGLRGRE